MGVSSSLEVNCEMVFECLIKKKKKGDFFSRNGLAFEKSFAGCYKRDQNYTKVSFSAEMQ